MNESPSLDHMIRPKSIAIIGASPNTSKISGIPLFRLKEFNYQGEIYPVNPKYEEIAGIRCYQDIESLPENIDLAIIMIKANDVLLSLEKLAERHLKSAIIFSSGFSEIGEEGEKAQLELSDLSQRTGMLICGPNSMGIFNLHDGMFGTFVQSTLDKKGPLAFITQSGAIGVVAYNMLKELGSGFSYFISTGNEAGVDFFDYVQYFSQQKDIKAIGGYLEGVRSFDKMEEALNTAESKKTPIVLLKGGNSKEGAEAATSHTASMAGDSKIFSSYFKKKNVIHVEDEDELIDTLAVFNKAKVSPNRGEVAIVTISGGAGILMVDKCEEYGVKLVELSSDTTMNLKHLLPDFASVKNPIDLTAQIVQMLDKLKECIEVVLADDQVETVIFYSPVGERYFDKVIPVLDEISSKTSKTFIVCWGGPSEKAKKMLNDSNVCWLPTPSRTIRAVRNHLEYNQQIDRSFEQSNGIKRLTESVEFSPYQDILNEFEGKRLLSKYGIPVPEGSIVTNAEKAVRVAENIGYPVVMKIVSKQIAHKSEAGAVKVNIKSAVEVKDAFHAIKMNIKKYNPEANIDGVLVEKMADEGIEVIMGAYKDPIFGPCIMFGLGGIFVEVLEDVVLCPAPLIKKDALELIESIKGYPILQGARGHGPYDIDALSETLVRVSEFCVDQAMWLDELDINPVIVHEKGRGVTALDALLITRPDSITYGTKLI